MLSNERLVKSWENAYSAVKESKNLWGKNSIPYIDKVISTLQSADASMILDFPCGDGRNTIVLANEFSIVVGADSSRSALKMLAAEVSNNNICNLVAIETNLFSSCFVDNYFDGILCWDVLGHLENPKNAMDELIRICKPGGIIIGSFFSDTEPCVTDIHMEKLNESDYQYRNDYFYRLYTKNMITDFVSTLKGITVLDIEHVIWKEPPHEGFREYEHEHHSWSVILEKEVN